jgi:hypothetical protein
VSQKKKSKQKAGDHSSIVAQPAASAAPSAVPVPTQIGSPQVISRLRVVYVVLEPHNHLTDAEPHINCIGITRNFQSEEAEGQVPLEHVVASLNSQTPTSFFVRLGGIDHDLATYTCADCGVVQLKIADGNLEQFARRRRPRLWRRVVFSNFSICLIAAIVVAAGLVASVHENDFGWFSRSGAIVAALGLILLVRNVVLGMGLLPDIYHLPTGYSSADPRLYQHLGQPVPARVQYDADLKYSIGFLGPILTFVGTVIWGFGDLLKFLIH